MNRAGGFFYHLRALRAARSRWRPFRDALGTFLRDDFDASPSLFLVGPSAAYCIEDAFLARFQRITALEPDPIARFRLARRARALGVPSLEFIVDDALVAPLVTGNGAALDGLLAEHPTASVVFANVLGQIRFLLPEADLEKWQVEWTKRIAPCLVRRPWMSFHDRVSAAVAPRLVMPYRTASRLSDQALGPAFYAHAGGTVELLDHLTAGLFPAELPHAYFHWELDRGAHHLVEAVCGPSARTP